MSHLLQLAHVQGRQQVRYVALGTIQNKHSRIRGKKESHTLLLKTPDLYSGDSTACIPMFSIYTEILSARKIACRWAVCDFRRLFRARVHGQYNDRILEVLALQFSTIHNINNEKLRHKGNKYQNLQSSHSSIKNQNPRCPGL